MHTLITALLTLHLLFLRTSAAPQQGRPPPPPDACERRNDTLPACPFGGDCNPTAGRHVCQRSCVNYQHADSRFWCSVPCGYAATTLDGVAAPNPLLCLKPTARNGLVNSCADSGWACYRRFGREAPLFRTAGPACSPRYEGCDPRGTAVAAAVEAKPAGAAAGANETAAAAPPGCGTGRSCVLDPRWRLARPFVVAAGLERMGICVPDAKACEGRRWDECGEGAECVRRDSVCRGRLGAECKGVCVQLFDLAKPLLNGTRLDKRDESTTQC
jgi:hypothetical protein